MKFQVGDKVMVSEQCPIDEDAGRFGVVTDLHEAAELVTYPYYVLLEGRGISGLFSEDELELVK